MLLLHPRHDDVMLVIDGLLASSNEAETTMTAGDSAARKEGYTRAVYIEGGMQSGEFLIQPDTDLDSTFRAWGTDWQEWTAVHGCNVLIEEVD